MVRAATRDKANLESSGRSDARDGKLLSDPLDKLLGYHLRRVQSATFQHFAAHLSHRDITPGQLGLLMLIGCNPGVSQATLAREVGVERSTLGEFIDRFESRQLVERRRVTTDRRVHAVHLTRKGRRFLDQVLPEVEAHEREFTKALSTQELQTLVQLLKRLAAHQSGDDVTAPPQRVARQAKMKQQ